MQLVELLRCVHHHRLRLHETMLGLDRRDLDQAATQVAAQQAQAAVRLERRRHRAHHRCIGRHRRRRRRRQHAVVQPRLAGECAHAFRHHGGQFVHQPGIEQFAEHEWHPAGGLEAVHVGLAVGIDPRQQWHRLRELVHVVPGQHDTGRARHRDPVDGVVGRTAGGHQRHHRVDDGAFVDQPAQRTVVLAQRGHGQHPVHRLLVQCRAQRRARVDEGAARQLHAHRLQQHLVGIGGAVEGAGPRRVVGLRLDLQQLFAAGLAGGVALAHLRLFLVWNAGGHRTCGHEQRRQVAEGQCADQQARHDLVADAQVQGGVEGVVAQGHRGGLGDHVAREQRQFHAAAALGDPIAHRRHATGDLGGGTELAGEGADAPGIGLVGLVRRQHVVVGGDDAQVGRGLATQARLVGVAAGGEHMGQVGAAQWRAVGPLAPGLFDPGQVGRARGGAAADDASGDALEGRMQGTGHGRVSVGARQIASSRAVGGLPVPAGAGRCAGSALIGTSARAAADCRGRSPRGSASAEHPRLPARAPAPGACFGRAAGAGAGVRAPGRRGSG